jgi:hypothetical protein
MTREGDPMEETIKCAHETCNCNVAVSAGVEVYCNEYCSEQGVGGADSPCQCGHVECAL